jgi:hypothetical protein
MTAKTIDITALPYYHEWCAGVGARLGVFLTPNGIPCNNGVAR